MNINLILMTFLKILENWFRLPYVWVREYERNAKWIAVIFISDVNRQAKALAVDRVQSVVKSVKI